MEYIRIFSLVLILFKYGEMSSEVYRCPSHLPRDVYLKTFRDQCYYFVNQELYWSAARDDCNNRGGGHHVIIRDLDTQNFVMRSLQQLDWNRNGIWIGAHDLDSEGDWKWVTDHPLTYTNWDSDQPGGCFLVFCHEDCANLRLANGKWHDYPCDSLVYTYICQYTMGPPTTTTSTTTTTTTTTTPTTTTTAVPTTTSTTTTTTKTTSTTTRLLSTTPYSKTSIDDNITFSTTTEVIKAPKSSERRTAVFQVAAVLPVALSVLIAVLFIVGGILMFRKHRQRRNGPKQYNNETYAVAFQALPRPNEFLNGGNTIEDEQKVTNINDCSSGTASMCDELKLKPNGESVNGNDSRIYNIYSESMYHEIGNAESMVSVGTLTEDHLFKPSGYNNNLYSQSEA